MSARKSTATIKKGQTFTFTGIVSPNHAGHKAYLQRLVDGAWKTAATGTLTSGSGYTLRATPPTKGTLAYRVYKSADRDHAPSGSARQTVKVT